jgi:hypothetical protein
VKVGAEADAPDRVRPHAERLRDRHGGFGDSFAVQHDSFVGSHSHRDILDVQAGVEKSEDAERLCEEGNRLLVAPAMTMQRGELAVGLRTTLAPFRLFGQADGRAESGLRQHGPTGFAEHRAEHPARRGLVHRGIQLLEGAQGGLGIVAGGLEVGEGQVHLGAAERAQPEQPRVTHPKGDLPAHREAARGLLEPAALPGHTAEVVRGFRRPLIIAQRDEFREGAAVVAERFGVIALDVRRDAQVLPDLGA